jgi:hypothetical protein
MSEKEGVDRTLDTSRINQVIGVLTFLIVIGKALPWITLALATWSMYLGIYDIKNQNWVWAVINVLLALGGYSFVAGLSRSRSEYRRSVNTRLGSREQFSREKKEAEVA